jgi:RNA polymerase sigma-70 factor, ECF subfamily
MTQEHEALWGSREADLGATSPGADEPLPLAAQRLAGGDLDALDAVWDLCARELYGLALWRSGSASDAEDVVQEVFLRLARAPKTLATARDPRAYLLTMAHHAAVDTRRRRRAEALDTALLLVVPDPAADPGRLADASRASALVHALPPRQREVVFLKHFAELTFREIGRVTGVPTFTASGRYRAALRRLREGMGVRG